MKPGIPETGIVITTDNGTAKVLLRGGEHCKNCGAGKIGLCRPAGDTALLTVTNDMGASAGDTVRIGLKKAILAKGLLLAFVFPLVIFLSGTLLGHVLGVRVSMPSLEVITGFFSFLLGSLYSMTRLRKMNTSNRMTVQAIISGKNVPQDPESGEEQRYNLAGQGSGQYC